MQIIKHFIPTILFLLIHLNGTSQAITYTESITHSKCNGINDGSITISITSTNGPHTFAWSSGGNTNTVSNLAPGNYSVTITDNTLYSTTASFTIQELPCDFNAELYFTPNGDGINDEWSIGGLSDYSDCLVIVYNRMGQKVFENKDEYKPWNGKDLLGRPLPDATYFYIIYANKNGKKPAEKGSVSILR